jgi:P27 family predicted phage terminase small subunit
MGHRGPKPKPVSLKLLAGNPGKRGAGSGGGRARLGAPPRPPELTGEAAAEWDRVVTELVEAGTLAVCDRGILAAYCLAVADMLAARAVIQADGRFLRAPVQTSKGEVVGESIRVHPAVGVLDKASARVHRLGTSLGLTPASRSRSGEAPAASRENKVVAIRERFRPAH